MRLKRVRIFGFKTFADKTEVALDGGLVAVVGPNGCGKSNLVDAILWGLGEGNSRHLRAQSGTDVIFNGSAQRRPVGYAEVSLLFDNEDGGLPIDSPEVQITRKLSRSGDSEYSINRQNCRLRDVLELLADSGLGRAGYAIVGQKEIDQALAASPEDRRAWIDEAAGVQRYRARKVEALKRLASAQDHLARVSDILTELEAQREPLREEAEVAARYKTIQTSLQGLEIDLLATELKKAIDVGLAARETIESQNRLMAEEEARRTKDSASLASAERAFAEANGRKDQLDRDRVELERRIAHLDAEIRLGAERVEGLQRLAASLSTEDELAAKMAEETREDLDRAIEEAVAEEQRLEEFEASSSGSAQLLNEMNGRLRAAELELEAARALQAKAHKQEAEARHRTERIALIARELAGIEESIPDSVAACASAREELGTVEDAMATLQVELDALAAARQASEKEVEASSQDLRRSLAEFASLEGRIRGIEATIESHEGLSQGAKAVLEANERGILPGNYLPVSRAVTADQKLALAIETALGAAQHDLIVESEREAKSAIAWLKEHRAGRATFQPIPLMRPVRVTDDLIRASREKGILGRASELVSFDRVHQPVVESLLGRILIAEDLDVALRLAKSTGWSRVVTVDGEVLQASGAVTGGTTGRASFGVIQRTAELEALRKQEASLSKRIEHLRGAGERGAEERAKSLEQTQAVQARRKEILAEVEDQRRFLQALEGELKAAERSRDRLLDEQRGLTAASEDPVTVPDLPAIEEKRDLILREIAGTQADVEGAAAKLLELRERSRAARQRVETAQRRLKASEEQTGSRAQRLAGIAPEIERLNTVAAGYGRAQESERQKLRALEVAGAKLEAQILERESDVAALTVRVRDAGSNQLALQGVLQQAEIARARSETQRANAAERLLEEYGVSEEDAVARAANAEVPPEAASLVGKWRREMRAMGDVNLGAIEAYARLTTRYDELSVQKEDVEEGMNQVQQSIRELDKLTRDRFVGTFEAVRTSYQSIFTRLFGGGEGDLRLLDPGNLLESGIEIEATLPGKKKQQLQLLSGGERSLCATAFLFALLDVRPSPLVVLDEVDAPLDGRNVERFVELLLEFSRKIQFIVITHNPTTMVQAPDLLGVSMEEPGVSLLLPVRLAAYANG